MRLADFRWLSIRCDAIRFDSIRRRTVARCAGPRFRFGRFALVDQISRERERENEWNGATFSPFLYFSGEGGERETGGTHQKQNGGGAKDDDDDDDDDVRINGRRVVHVCVSISAARVAFFCCGRKRVRCFYLSSFCFARPSITESDRAVVFFILLLLPSLADYGREGIERRRRLWYCYPLK